jgi:thiamine biosynthesis lipoprotein
MFYGQRFCGSCLVAYAFSVPCHHSWRHVPASARVDQPASRVLTHCLVLLAFLLTACSRDAARTDHVFEGATMGTTYTVKVVTQGPLGASSAPKQEQVQQVIEERLADVDEKMSTYRPTSELSRFNRSRATEPFPVSAETLEVFAEAQRISAATGGAFDITVGPLVNAWGFGPDGPSNIPSEDDLAALRNSVGYTKLIIDPTAGTARKTDPALYVDLSSVAKGYAVDRVAELLEELDLPNYLVEIGGEVRVNGHNAENAPWQVGIQKPVDDELKPFRIVALTSGAIASSGDYQNYYMKGDQRISHIIDPRTGHPVPSELASVSVIEDRCAVADAWATALTVLGPEDGLRAADEHGMAVLFILRTSGGAFTEHPSTVFAEQFPKL